jgi:hypothetical protein
MSDPNQAVVPDREHPNRAEVEKELSRLTAQLRTAEAEAYNTKVREAARARGATDSEVVLIVLGVALSSPLALLGVLLHWSLSVALCSVGIGILSFVAVSVHRRREGEASPW